MGFSSLKIEDDWQFLSRMDRLPIHPYLKLLKKYRDTHRLHLLSYHTNRNMNAMKYSAERVSRTNTLWQRAWPITYLLLTIWTILNSSLHCRNTNLILSVDIHPYAEIASLEWMENCVKPTISRKQITSGDKQSKRDKERLNPSWTELGEISCC